jgi:hypothetical protein
VAPRATERGSRPHFDLGVVVDGLSEDVGRAERAASREHEQHDPDDAATHGVKTCDRGRRVRTYEIVVSGPLRTPQTGRSVIV